MVREKIQHREMKETNETKKFEKEMIGGKKKKLKQKKKIIIYLYQDAIN